MQSTLQSQISCSVIAFSSGNYWCNSVNSGDGRYLFVESGTPGSSDLKIMIRLKDVPDYLWYDRSIGEIWTIAILGLNRSVPFSHYFLL